MMDCLVVLYRFRFVAWQTYALVHLDLIISRSFNSP